MLLVWASLFFEPSVLMGSYAVDWGPCVVDLCSCVPGLCPCAVDFGFRAFDLISRDVDCGPCNVGLRPCVASYRSPTSTHMFRRPPRDSSVLVISIRELFLVRLQNTRLQTISLFIMYSDVLTAIFLAIIFLNR